MRYELPQFINIEDKIFGPFTFFQFIYLGGGAGLSYVLWQILPMIIAVIIIVPIIGLSLALAFYKVNGRPFIFVMQSALSHAFKSKFYLWKKGTHKTTLSPKRTTSVQIGNTPSRTSNLREISFNLDMLDMDDPNANRGRK